MSGGDRLLELLQLVRSLTELHVKSGLPPPDDASLSGYAKFFFSDSNSTVQVSGAGAGAGSDKGTSHTNVLKRRYRAQRQLVSPSLEQRSLPAERITTELSARAEVASQAAVEEAAAKVAKRFKAVQGEWHAPKAEAAAREEAASRDAARAFANAGEALARTSSSSSAHNNQVPDSDDDEDDDMVSPRKRPSDVAPNAQTRPRVPFSIDFGEQEQTLRCHKSDGFSD